MSSPCLRTVELLGNASVVKYDPYNAELYSLSVSVCVPPGLPAAPAFAKILFVFSTASAAVGCKLN